MRTISVEHSLTVLVETMSVLGNFGRLLYIGNGPIGERLKLFYESGLLEHFQWMRPGESITLDSWHSSNWIVIDFDLPEIGSHPALTRLPSTTLKAVSDLFLRMAEFLDLSRDHGPNAPHVVSVINAEANEFQQAVAIFVDAPGGQTAFRVRTGSIRQAVHPRRVNIFLRFLLATSIPLVSRHRSGPRRPYPDNVDRDTCITRVFKYVTKTIRKCLRVPWNKLGLLKRSAIKYETWIIRKSDPSTVLRLYAGSLALGSRRSDEFYELRD